MNMLGTSWKPALCTGLMGLLLLVVSLKGVGQQAHDTVSPYTHWTHGPSRNPNEFPIAVWLQDPANAARYKAADTTGYQGRPAARAAASTISTVPNFFKPSSI